MNKAAYYVPDGDLRKDANVVVDGRKLHNDGKCLSIERRSKLLINLGEILNIHHIIVYFETSAKSWFFMGIYIPIFLSGSYFCLVLLFSHVTMSTITSVERKIYFFSFFTFSHFSFFFSRNRMQAWNDPVICMACKNYIKQW